MRPGEHTAIGREALRLAARRVDAQRTPAEHSAQSCDSLAEGDPVRADPERDQAFFVVALPHLEDVEPPSKLGLDLDVPEEEDVVEDEREPAEVCALAERSHLV